MTAIRNGADVLILETKSKLVILVSGRGFSRVLREAEAPYEAETGLKKPT